MTKLTKYKMKKKWRVNENWSLIRVIQNKKVDWLGYNIKREGLIKDVLEVSVDVAKEMTEKRKITDNLTENGTYFES